MWDGFDKRKFPRMNLPCDIEIRSTEKSAPLKAITENVGIGGVCVLLEKSLERFSECRLRLNFSKKNEGIACQGRVVWIVKTGDVRGRKHHYDVGIEFTDISDEQRDRLKEQIEHYAANHSEQQGL